MTTRIRNGDKIIFNTVEKIKNTKTVKLEEVQYKGKHLSSFSELYKNYDN
jgi:ASC-1-like (ASCH) protein